MAGNFKGLLMLRTLLHTSILNQNKTMAIRVILAILLTEDVRNVHIYLGMDMSILELGGSSLSIKTLRNQC